MNCDPLVPARHSRNGLPTVLPLVYAGVRHIVLIAPTIPQNLTVDHRSKGLDAGQQLMGVRGPFGLNGVM